MRHSWRLDAKWLVAILFVLCAIVASVTYSLYRITAHEPASGAAASVIDALAEEMVDEELFAELKAAAQASPDTEVQVNQLILPLTGKEIADLTREETLEKASARLADIIYYEGVDAAQAYFQDLAPAGDGPESADAAPPEQQGEEGLPLEPLGLFTQETHDKLGPFALGLPLAAAALLALLVLLSRGFGRLGSPGLALVVGVGPAALTFTVLRSVFADVRDDEGGIFPAAARTLYPTIDDLARLFTIIVAVGAVLVVVAVGGHVATWAVGRLRARPAEPEAEPADEPTPGPAPLEAALDEEPPAGGEEFPSIGPGGVPQA